MRTIEETAKAEGKLWAYGCPKCKFGIVGSLPLTRALPLFEERAMQYGNKDVQVCDCRAGHMQRQHLRRWYGGMGERYRVYLRQILDTAAEAMPPALASSETGPKAEQAP